MTTGPDETQWKSRHNYFRQSDKAKRSSALQADGSGLFRANVALSDEAPKRSRVVEQSIVRVGVCEASRPCLHLFKNLFICKSAEPSPLIARAALQVSRFESTSPKL